ncbi:hypothetical protein [Pseudalkalibacillus decolorationis]|uniref:hypothetical protein n=1 Tax=Pseudalkalibacillus decolorationis TaxID=163879 RepID=UPI0021481390|nr:hypothetical protein [Pseudalkalibacillus decolorationis]
MFKIGVVGPERSVERILSMAKEFEQGMEFIPFPYKDPKETKRIILECNDQIDSWLLSGPIPYEIAKDTLGSDENLEHIWLTESSLYKCFLDMIYSKGKLLERVSIDIPSSTNTVEEALQQLETAPRELYLRTFDVDIDPKELFQFHFDLWENGKTEGVFTCFPSVFEDLKKAEVPTYWISPSRMEILQSLRIFDEKVRTSYFKDTQIGVEIIEIEHFDKFIEKAKSSYHLQYLELKLKETLLQLCEKLDGSLSEKGNGRYVIFSSRGVIEQEIRMLQETVRYLSVEAETTVAVGIGFGKTVLLAETNARRAIQQSKEKDQRGIVIVQEDGTIVESVGQEKELTYAYRTEDKEVMEKIKKGNVGIKTYNKIDALTRRMGWSDFTTKDLATHLNMTERHTRRILTELCAADLAERIGEEAHSSRGRPSTIYRLK